MRNQLLVKIFITFLVLSSLAYSQKVWQKYANNPVLSTWSGAIDDPSGYKYASEPGVYYDSSVKILHMWFSSYTFDYGAKINISEALSFNGIEWYTYAKNPVLQRGVDGAYDENVRNPEVIRDDVGFKMYYTGTTNDFHYRIGLATSLDGKNWTKYSPDPVLTVGPNGSWDYLDVRFGSVDYDPGRPPDSRYMMWYCNGDAHVIESIGLATSSDGITWTKYPGNPIFVRSNKPTDWDYLTVSAPSVVRVNGNYYMFYLGSNGGNRAIGWAYSFDGMNWERGDTLPIITNGEGWDDQLGNLEVKYFDNTFHMWYSGYTHDFGWQLGYATSVYDPHSLPPALPQDYFLYNSYPNPFNPKTVIEYDIPKATPVVVKIINTLGQEVATLVNEDQTAGHHKVTWDAARNSSASSGAYYYQLIAGGTVQTKKNDVDEMIFSMTVINI